MTTEAEIKKFIRESIDWLINEDQGCCSLELDDVIALCVGWSDGFDKNDKTVIHSISEPTWAIAIRLGVYSESYMKTDLDLDFPFISFADSTELFADLVTPSTEEAKDDDYLAEVAQMYLADYNEFRTIYKINDKGVCYGHNIVDDLAELIEDAVEMEQIEVLREQINNTELYASEVDELLAKLKLKEETLLN